MTINRDSADNGPYPNPTTGYNENDYPAEAQEFSFLHSFIVGLTPINGTIMAGSGGGWTATVEASAASDGEILVVDSSLPNPDMAFRGISDTWTLWYNQTTTTGTEKLATSLPDWVSELRIGINAVSADASQRLIMQLGTAGSPTYKASGYAGNIDREGQSANSHSTDFILTPDAATAGSTHSGTIYLYHYGNNMWFLHTRMMYDSSGMSVNGNHGHVTLPDVLTTLRFAWRSGASFDAGSIKIWYK